MIASELRNKSVKELNNELLGVLQELFNMQTQKAIGQTIPTHRVKNARRDVARIKTILREKEGDAL